MANATQFQSILEHLISNHEHETYSISELCEETGLSRFQVHRTIKATLGLSFSQLLLRIRIIRSVRLLVEKAGNVSEIAYSVGFNSPSYFSKCYTTIFCKSPGTTLASQKLPVPKNSQFKKLLYHPHVKPLLIEKGIVLEDMINSKSVRKVSVLSLSLIFLVIGITLISLLAKTDWLRAGGNDILGSMISRINGSAYINPADKVKLSIFTFRRKAIDTNNQEVGENLKTTSSRSEFQWLGTGISIALTEDLGQNRYIISQRKKSRHLADMIHKAQSEKQDYFLTGNYAITSNLYFIDFVLYDSKTTRAVHSFSLEGENFFDLIDSATLVILPKLGLHKNQISLSNDLPIAEYMTSSFEAFREYSRAYMRAEPSRSGNFEYDQSYMQKAIRLDSSFALAGYRIADVFNYWLANKAVLRESNRIAMTYRSRLNDTYRLQILGLNYQIIGEHEKATQLMELQTSQIEPIVSNFRRLVNLYITNYRFEDALKTQKKLVNEFEIVDDECDLVYYYMLAGQTNKAVKLANQLRMKYPENPQVKEQCMRLLLHIGKYGEAREVRDELVLLEPETAFVLSLMDSLFISQAQHLHSDIKDYTGTYRMPESGMEAIVSVVNGQLRFAYQNQPGSFHYQYKPGRFISTIWLDQTHKKHFVRNKDGKIIKLINHEFLKDSSTFEYVLWKEDSLIQTAFFDFDNHSEQAALNTFKEALRINPEHQYLLPYIQHLEFIQSSEFNNKVNEHFAGKWFIVRSNNIPDEQGSREPDINITERNGQLIYSRNRKISEFMMMPISTSEAKFHTYSDSNKILFQITREDDSLYMTISKYNESSQKYINRSRLKKEPERQEK